MPYLGVPPFGQTVRTITELTATAGQTSFLPSGGYLPGYVDVFLNGVSLDSSDFTATNGIAVVLTDAAALNDEVKTVAYWPVSLIDTYRKGEVDAGFVAKDSATGAALMPVGTTAQRPTTPTSGMYRMNSTTAQPEWYDLVNGEWRAFSSVSYSIEYLVIAGGGGGFAGYGNGNGTGGGGAGGYVAASIAAVISGTSFAVTVGAGGAGGTANRGSNQGGSPGANGTNSVFSSTTAIGGGRGQFYENGASGGSGGAGFPAGGVGTSGQGNAGGINDMASLYLGGGGGGAGGAGVNGISGGTGGAGATWLDGVTRAGGGGGGRYPSGGAGAGGTGGGGGGGSGTGGGGSGVANTGSGGGGGGSPGTGSTGGVGGNGGSGVVIVRYLGPQQGTGGTVTSAGGYTYHTFTTSGTFTA